MPAKLMPTFCGYRVLRDQRNGSPRPYSRFSRHNPKILSKDSQTTKTSCDHRWKPFSKLVWKTGSFKKVYSAAISILNYPSSSVILFSHHNSYSKHKNLSWFSEGILLLPVLGASVHFYRLPSTLLPTFFEIIVSYILRSRSYLSEIQHLNLIVQAWN
jgi:hypothetical protein